MTTHIFRVNASACSICGTTDPSQPCDEVDLAGLTTVALVKMAIEDIGIVLDAVNGVAKEKAGRVLSVLMQLEERAI